MTRASSRPTRRFAAGPATPRRRSTVCPARGTTRRRDASLQGRGRPLRTQELQGARRRVRGVPGAAAGGRSAQRRQAGRLARTDRGTCRDITKAAHRHLRHRRQPWTLRRLGREALRLPLRHLRARDRERGAVRRDRAVRRGRRPRAGQLRRLGAPRRGRGAQERLDRGVRHDATRATARFRST